MPNPTYPLHSTQDVFGTPQTEDEVRRALDQIFSQLRESRAQLPVSIVRCGIYDRLSKVDPTSTQYSIDIQTDQAAEFARAQGWQVVAVYNDPDVSGRHSRRKGLQQAQRDAKAGRLDVLLIHRVDRSFRNLGSLIKFMNMMVRYHVRVIFVAEQFDTESPGGRMMLYVLGAVAELYVRITSQRVREMKEARYARGLPNGSHRLGYCNGRCSRCTDPNGPGYCPLVGGPDRGNGRVLVPHPIEQHAVQLIAQLYHEHWSDGEIADYLNSNVFRLPDGSLVKFRTKSIASPSSPGLFTDDSIRVIVRNPFCTGYVARYPSKPLDMEDDPEHPDWKPDRPKQPAPNRRIPLQLIKGRHAPLIAFELWQQNQLIRQSKGRTSTSNAKPKEINPFTSVARCWECYASDGSLANLRGSSGSADNRHYGRCGRWQDAYRVRQRQKTLLADQALATNHLTAQPIARELAERHRNIPLAKIQTAIVSLVNRFVIPPDWYDAIIAYFLIDDGLIEFKLQSQELHQRLERVKQLHAEQIISRAEAIQNISQINAQLRRLQPSAHPAATELIPLLQDFPALWQQLEPIEQRSLLKTMFTGMFFDAQGQLRLTLANSPFDTLLNIPDEGAQIA